MAVKQALILLTSAFLVSGQRPFFAGSRPIGFPELQNKTTTPSVLEDKFGEVTTQRLPIEANGDRELIDRLSKLPIDKQPFWFINWQALEAQREKPQTYPQRPNPFFEGNPQNNAPQIQSNNANPSFSVVSSNPGFSNANASPSPIPSGSSNINSGSGIQTSNWKVQTPVDTKNAPSNVDNRYGNAASGPSTSTISNDKDPRPITSNSDDIKQQVLPNPGSIFPSPDNKNVQKPKVAQEENEFEDIQVRKNVKNL